MLFKTLFPDEKKQFDKFQKELEPYENAMANKIANFKVEKKQEVINGIMTHENYQLELDTFIKSKHTEIARLKLLIEPISYISIQIIQTFKEIKTFINSHVNNKDNLATINTIYTDIISKSGKNADPKYQNKIPSNCDGIWIKPLFNLIDYCIIKPDIDTLTAGITELRDLMRRMPEDRRLGGKKKKYGGCSVDKELGKLIPMFNIDENKLKIHKIFDKLNNNIIFVFSDIMYLNIYINENLNTSSFQENMKDRINNLLSYNIPVNEGQNSKLCTLINKENEGLSVDLNRNLDGIYNIYKKEISNHHIIKENFSFTVDTTCNYYTTTASITESC